MARTSIYICNIARHDLGDMNDRTNVDLQRVPWWAWLNVFSLDAVIVAVVWQSVFVLGLMNRLPSLAESASLGLTVWLVYVADRLLDARRLNLSVPHSLRHHLHARYGRPIAVAWIGVLLLDTAIVLSSLESNLVRWGIGLASLVLVYGAVVHLLPDRVREQARPRWHFVLFSKEIYVGILFAIGVSLPCWASTPSIHLLLLTFLAGALFAANCIAVASWEQELDRVQSFHSMLQVFPHARRLTALSLVMGGATILAWLPYSHCRIVTGSLSVCAFVLGMLCLTFRNPGDVMQEDDSLGSSRDRRLVVVQFRGVLADVSLWCPLLILWLVT